MSQQCVVVAINAEADLGTVNGRAQDVVFLLCFVHPDHDIQHIVFTSGGVRFELDFDSIETGDSDSSGSCRHE